MLHVSNINKEGSWVVKTLINDHKCLQTRNVKLCTVSWLAKDLETTIFVNPSVPLGALQDQIHRKYQIFVSRQKVFRAKAMAIKKIEGDYKAQYELLRDYCEELLKSNPGSSIKIDVESEPNPHS